jgi:hypothetical protein
MALYCFDTSAWIGCWSRMYPLEVFPGLWAKVDDLISHQVIVCPDEVLNELKRQEDDLAKWMAGRSYMFLELDEGIQQATSDVLRAHPLLMKATKNRNAADPFVIGTAVARSLAVVTEEVGGTVTKPKIPSVCAALGVRCIGPLEFVREQGWTFA